MRSFLALPLLALLAFPALVSAQVSQVVRTPLEQREDDRFYAITAMQEAKVFHLAWLEVYRQRPDLEQTLGVLVGTVAQNQTKVGALDHTLRVLEGCK